MLEQLFIANYRCFESVTIDLVDRPSALVIGKNGTGKSTLRQALGVLQQIGRGANRVKQLVSSADFAQGRIHLPIRIEANFRVAGKRVKYGVAFELPENFREAR